MTGDEFNTLPEPVSRCIRDLVTRRDPADEVQERRSLWEQPEGLLARVRELEQPLASLAGEKRRSR